MPRKKISDAPTPVPALAAVPKAAAPRSAKSKVAVLSPSIPDAPSHGDIAEAAYLRFLNRGGQPGDALNDWVEAERELKARRAYAKAG